MKGNIREDKEQENNQVKNQRQRENKKPADENRSNLGNQREFIAGKEAETGRGRGGGKVFSTRKLCSGCLEKLLLNVEVRKKENCKLEMTGSGSDLKEKKPCHNQYNNWIKKLIKLL